jgi:hypothetical protein
MAITAQSVIKSVQEQLQDLAGIRWSAPELVMALNDGQRQLVILRPELHAVQAEHVLVAGAKQAVPANCSMLMDIPRNTTGHVIRKVERRLLDSMEPNWYSKAGALTIKHITVDKTEPDAFYVYPPAAVGAKVELLYAQDPVDVPAPGGPSYTSVTGNIGVDDSLNIALAHYCLYWAFSKDAEYGGNTTLSGMHFKLYQGTAGMNVPASAPAPA